MKFLWRKEDGKIIRTIGESANNSLNSIGNVLSWDSDLNSVDVKLPSNKIEKLYLTGCF
jgi:hypothetical protein